MCKICKCKGVCCIYAKILHVLLIIGGLNWGLVGLGYLIGTDLNVVNLLLGGVPTVEAIVYLLVGIAALVSIFGCGCRKCRNGMCGPAKKHSSSAVGGQASTPPGQMPSSSV